MLQVILYICIAFPVRPVPVHDEASLTAKSDVIVIATAIKNQLSSRDIAPELDHLGDSARSVTTTLKIAVAFKGNLKKDAIIKLYHHRLNPARTVKNGTNYETIASNGPRFVHFETAPRSLQTQGRARYLIYLKNEGTRGVYVPTTGHEDSVDSVRILSSPK